MRRHWLLDPAVRFLNHGSFGACPRNVLEAQSLLRERMERQPVQFLARELPGLLAEARRQLAPHLGVQPGDFVFVRNATEGVNAVLRSLRFELGDELLTTNHAYAACANALRFVAEQAGAKLVVVDVPFPLHSPAQVVEAIARGVTPRTRLALVDHVTSITGLVFPIRNIVRVLRDLGVDTLVDGAHAPGMVDLDVESIGAGYYAANFHKWFCAPKGAGMLWVRRDLQPRIAPPVISHGLSAPRESRFQALFDWTGTSDPTPWLCVTESVHMLQSLLPGGLSAVRGRNRRLALYARDVLCRALGVEPPAPDEMLGALAAVPLPGTGDPELLYRELLQRGFETLVKGFPSSQRRVLRVSAQLYNTEREYDELAELLPRLP